jgi:hypothetical protein
MFIPLLLASLHALYSDNIKEDTSQAHPTPTAEAYCTETAVLFEKEDDDEFSSATMMFQSL